MPYLPLQIQPGVYRNGTEYQSKGRWYDANLVRWYSGEMRPVGGWQARSASTVSGKARAVTTWKDNSSVSWIGIGTHTKLYAMTRSGALHDITPSGFTTGRADATTAGGYGGGTYGTGAYGTPRLDTTAIQDASVWTLDTWGEYLVGCMADDGDIYEWTLNTAVAAAAVTNAPTARAIVVTEERFLMALGAGGNPRKVQWSDQEANTTWTPAPANQAGDFELQTAGRLMCGKRVRGGTLLFTDVDVHLANYIGGTLVYGFDRISSSSGIISQQACAVFDGRAVWMSQNGFWGFNGYVEPVACDVHDYVFSDLNRVQASKVYAVHNSQFGEVWWFYPSAASNEIDRYVIWNYRENHWSIGQLVRLCGTDRGAFNYPIMIGSDGTVYEHEAGFGYGSASLYARSGPVELGSGDNVMTVRGMVPDERTAGDVTVTFYVKPFPNGDEETFGPYTAANPVDFLFTGRQVEVKYTGSALADWRVGTPRLDVVARGGR